jgi:hypothetical protein
MDLIISDRVSMVNGRSMTDRQAVDKPWTRSPPDTHSFFPSFLLLSRCNRFQQAIPLPGGYIPRVEKERECWKFLDWRLNSENDSRVHGQPSWLTMDRVLARIIHEFSHRFSTQDSLPPLVALESSRTSGRVLEAVTNTFFLTFLSLPLLKSFGF